MAGLHIELCSQSQFIEVGFWTKSVDMPCDIDLQSRLDKS